jgi:hypothetical protein
MPGSRPGSESVSRQYLEISGQGGPEIETGARGVSGGKNWVRRRT